MELSITIQDVIMAYNICQANYVGQCVASSESASNVQSLVRKHGRRHHGKEGVREGEESAMMNDVEAQH